MDIQLNEEQEEDWHLQTVFYIYYKLIYCI